MADHDVGDVKIFYDGAPCCCGAFCAWCAGTKYLITEKYAEKKQDVVVKKIENVPFSKITEVKYTECCACCCGCGHLILYTSDAELPEMHITGICAGKRVYKNIRNHLAGIK